MKNFFVAASFFLVLVTVGAASAQTKKFSFGIKGGVNLSKLSMGEFLTTRYDANGNPYLNYNGQEVRDNLKESVDSKTGWSGGVYARFGSGFFVQPEVLVSTKGGSFDIVKTDNGGAATQKVNFKFSSIDVPILFGLKGGPFRVNAGPVASFRIGENQRLKDAINHYTRSSDALSEAVYGYQLGAGLDIFGISIDVRREGTFSSLSSFQIKTGEGDTVVKQKLKSWQVTLGIKLI